MVLVGGPSESGDGMNVLRKREGALEVGELRAAKEGRPISGELVRLSPRKDAPRMFDVEVLFDARKKASLSEGERTGVGPAQVATEAYRTNWDAVFGKRRKRGQTQN